MLAIKLEGVNMAVKTDTSLTIRTNKAVKQKAQELFNDLGMDMSTAINVFLRQAIYYGGLPFEIRREEPNADTLAAMHEVRQMKEDSSLGKTYTDVDEMMRELLA